jgi:lysophospholipase L1-like esterase
MHRIVRHAAVIALLASAAHACGDEFFFKDGDRVVMIGDSITEQHLYSNYVEMWVATRFPAWDITFRNVGIGGDRSTGGNSRFKRDVLVHKPTAMTVDFGMNDGGYRAFDEPGFKTYLGGLRGMADQAQKAGIRVAWVTPQPLDTGDPGPTALTGYNLTLEKYSTGVKAIADKSRGLFVDQFHPYLSVLDKARAAIHRYERITSGDAVHPGPPGQSLMAYGILKGLHFPVQVSSVEIELAEANGVKSSDAKGINCRVTELERQGDGIRFQRQDAALPFFPEEARSILKWAPVLEELNAYTLKVIGLKSGKYEIRLGGKLVAEHSAEELAKGVNLAAAALSAGPVAEQAKAVKAAIEAKNKYHHDRIFRGVVLAQVPDWFGTSSEVEARRQAAYAERMAKMPELDRAVRKTLEIKPHTVEIAPAAK